MYAENCKIGFDLWQVKSGTIFDNMMITDDPAEAKAAGEALWAVTKEAEKKMKDAQDEEERAKGCHQGGREEDEGRPGRGREGKGQGCRRGPVGCHQGGREEDEGRPGRGREG